MSTPVVTDRWAGQFDCDVCRRKRLVGEEFSKKALERYRKNGGPLKCKACVAQTEAAERQAAAAKQSSAPSATDEKRTCASCQKSLEYASYNKNQWAKGEGKSRCRSCVETALKQEASAHKESKETKIKEAKERVEQAKATGNAQQVLKAESELAALEAEKVTGLKPVSLGKGRGGRGKSIRSNGGRFRGRGSGRR